MLWSCSCLLYAVVLKSSACSLFLVCEVIRFFMPLFLSFCLPFLLFCFTDLLYFQAIDASAVVMAVGMTPVPALAVVTVPGRDFLAPLALALWFFHGFRSF